MVTPASRSWSARRYLQSDPYWQHALTLRREVRPTQPVSKDEYEPVPPARLVEETLRDLNPAGDSCSGAERAVTSVPEMVSSDRGLERLTPARIAEIRARLAYGLYGSPAVVTELARRLLLSGEL